MVDTYGRELKRLLAAHGCTFVRNGKGDHEIWYSPITNQTVTVDARTRKRFTAEAALKQAGIKERIK
jgi:ribosomal protein L16/L10AE